MTKCNDCRYLNEDEGECYAMPPVAYVSPNCYNQYVRPMVESDDIACSLYKRKELKK